MLQKQHGTSSYQEKNRVWTTFPHVSLAQTWSNQILTGPCIPAGLGYEFLGLTRPMLPPVSSAANTAPGVPFSPDHREFEIAGRCIGAECSGCHHLSPWGCQRYSCASQQRKYPSGYPSYKVVRFHCIREAGNILKQETCPKCFLDSPPSHNCWP